MHGDTIKASGTATKVLKSRLEEFMRQLMRRIVEIVSRRDFEYSELQSAIVAMVWGVCFFFAGEPLVTRDAITLGCVFVGLGGVQLAGLKGPNYRVRRGCALMSVILWLFIGGTFAEYWRPFLCATCFCFAAAAAWGYVRLGHYLVKRTRVVANPQVRSAL